jgi:AsmA protein
MALCATGYTIGVKALPKILLALVGVVLLVLVGLAVAVALLFDPKDYQPLLAQSVEKSTGRKLSFEGDLDLKLFPCCSVRLGRTALGNPPGFPATPFASVESAQLSIQVWPLIRSREVRIGKVKLEGLNADLIARADGTANWQFEGATKEERPAAEQEGPGDLLVRNIEGIEISNGRVAYRDEQSKSDWLVEDLALETGSVKPGEPFDFTLGAKLTDRADGTAATIGLKSTATLGEDSSRVTLAKPALDVEATGKALPAKKITAKLGAAELVVESKQDTTLAFRNLEGDVTMPGLTALAGDLEGSFVAPEARLSSGASTELTLPGLTADLTVRGKDIPGDTITAKLKADLVAADVDKLRGSVGALTADLNGLGARMLVTGRGRFGEAGADLAGTVKVDPLSPRSVLAVLKRPEPKTTDPKALTRFAGSADWALGKDSLALSKADFTLDQTHVTGSLGFAPLDAPVTRFDLAVEAIDLDRYLEPTPAEDAGGGDGSKTSDTDIPVDTLRGLKLDGRLRAGELTVAKARMSAVSATVRASGGKLRLDPLVAKLYGGEYRGAVAIDASGKTAAVTLDQQISALQTAGILKDVWQSQRLTGALSGHVVASGTGNSTGALMKTLSGNVAVDLADGAWLGTDLWHEIRSARARIKGDAPPPAPAAPQTRIEAMRLAGDISGGVLRTKEMLAEIPFIRMSGDGALDLAQKALDFRLQAAVIENPTFEDGSTLKDLKGLTIPLTLKGSTEKPKVGVDIKNLAAGAATQKLKDRLIKKLGLDEPATDGAATGAAGTSNTAPATTGQPKEEKPRDQLKKTLRDLLKPKEPAPE